MHAAVSDKPIMRFTRVDIDGRKSPLVEAYCAGCGHYILATSERSAIDSAHAHLDYVERIENS